MRGRPTAPRSAAGSTRWSASPRALSASWSRWHGRRHPAARCGAAPAASRAGATGARHASPWLPSRTLENRPRRGEYPQSLRDIVEPQGNEQALIAMAKRLSIGGLVMLYPKRAELPAAEGLVLVPGRISDGARKGPLVFSVAMTAEPDMALQNGVDAIFGMELATRQDGLHARHSGMNQVRCAAAKEKDVLTGIALRPMLEAGPYLRARLLGRHSQNLPISQNPLPLTLPT